MPKQTITPGPWEHGHYNQVSTVFWARGNGTVAIATIHDIASLGDPDANAQAIAAVPDMIEALLAAKDKLADMPLDSDRFTKNGSTLDRVIAALRKAGQID